MTRVREWKPGDVAAMAPPTSNRAFCISDDGNGEREPVLRWIFADGSGRRNTVNEDYLRHARPLAVIDPESDDVERLAQIFCSAYPNEGWVELMRNALREFADPKPRIEEPTNWLATVADDKGVEWYRWSVAPKHADRAWLSSTDEGRCYPTAWSEVRAVRVLSEGVTA